MDILPQLIVNGIIAGSIYSLIAIGFTFVFSVTKFFNFAHGVMAAVGGYTVFFLTRTFQIGVIPSVIAGVLAAGLLGYGLDKAIYLPLRRRKASNMVLLVASLGAFIVIQASIAILFSSQFQTLAQGSGLYRVYDIGGGVFTRIQLLLFGSSVAVLFALALLYNFTKFGASARAISDDEEVAKIVGINTDRIVSYVFFIGSSIAGLCGILVGFDTGIEPTMGLILLLKGVIASIVGGIGNLFGAVLGSYLLGFVENFGIWKISGEWKDAIAFTLLIIFLLFRPQGIIKK